MKTPSILLRMAALFSTKHALESADSSLGPVSKAGYDTAPDACAQLVSSPIGGYYINTAAAVEKCYNSFVVTKSDKQQQIDALKGYFNLYPYKDIITDSKEPFYPMQFDLFDAFDAISADSSITTEYQLESAISETLAKLQDGHVSYLPQCFSHFYFYQPFDMMPVYKNGEVHIYIQDTSVEPKLPHYSSFYNHFWKAALAGRTPDSLKGAKVISIDGKDPIDYLQDFADKYNGIGHAPEARFNSLFPTYRWPLLDQPILASFSVQTHAHKEVSYELECEDGTKLSVTFPWAAIMSKSATASMFAGGADAYYKGQCTHWSTRKNQIHHQGLHRDPSLFAYHRSSGNLLREQEEASKDISVVDMLKPAHSDEHGAFFKLSDGKTGVWMMSTFDPEDSTQPGLDAWVRNITVGLRALEDQGAERLIVDLSNNGGGYVCYGWGVLNYLFPHSNLDHLQYTFRMTDSVADLLVSNNETADFMVGGLTLDGKPITDYWNQIVEPGTRLAGFKQQYSNHFLNGCPKLDGLVPLKKGWKAKDIILVSNGVCGSTCAQFTTVLRNQLNVRTVTYGGGRTRSFKDCRNFDPTSFAAGDVITFCDTLDFFNSDDGVKHVADSPDEDEESRKKPVKFRFPLRGGQMPFWTSVSTHSKYPEEPIEWIKDKSDFYLEGGLMNDPRTIWDGILREGYFEKPFQAGAKSSGMRPHFSGIKKNKHVSSFWKKQAGGRHRK